MDLTFCKYRAGQLCLKSENELCSTTLDWKMCAHYDLKTEDGISKFSSEQPECIEAWKEIFGGLNGNQHTG